MARRFEGFPDEALTWWRGIERNNERDWFREHHATYRSAVREPMGEFLEAVRIRLAKFAPEYAGEGKPAISLPHRDRRFQPDLPPYKTFLTGVFRAPGAGIGEGAAMSVTVGLEGVSLIGGLLRPASGVVDRIRRAIDEDARGLRRALRRPLLREIFGEVQGRKCLRVPSAYEPDHPDGDLLRHSTLFCRAAEPVELLLSPDLVPRTVRAFRAVLPLVRWLDEALGVAATR